MVRVTSRSWTSDDIAKLQRLVMEGASTVRASAALKRSQIAVRGKAREIGCPFPRRKRRAVGKQLIDGWYFRPTSLDP